MSIKIPKQTRQDDLFEAIQEDEQFRFPRIKLNRDKPLYEVADPLPDDPENIALKKELRCVILLAKKNAYQSPEDKEKGEPVKDKRELYLLRTDKLVPEQIFLSPTSVRPWKEYLSTLQQQGHALHTVTTVMTAEKVSSKTTGFTWNKVKFTVGEKLEEEEVEYVESLATVVASKVRTFVDGEELDKLEEEFLGWKTDKDDDEDDVAVVKKHSSAVVASLESDDDDDEPPKRRAKAKAVEDDDEEEERPRRTRKSTKKAAVEDDDDEPVRPAKQRELDDDDDDELSALLNKSGKVNKRRSLDDDDDED